MGLSSLSRMDLRLWPNPATTEVAISVEGWEMSNDQQGMSNPDEKSGQVVQVLDGDLTVLDAQGRVAWQQRFGSLTSGTTQQPNNPITYQLSVADFAAGLYFVTLRSEGRTVTKRLVVQR